jgi:hypothetical protein
MRLLPFNYSDQGHTMPALHVPVEDHSSLNRVIALRPLPPRALSPLRFLCNGVSLLVAHLSDRTPIAGRDYENGSTFEIFRARRACGYPDDRWVRAGFGRELTKAGACEARSGAKTAANAFQSGLSKGLQRRLRPG